MADIGASEALATAGAIAAQCFEIKDPILLQFVKASLPPAIVGLALLMVETDPEYSARWLAAGSDWMARGGVLTDVILFLLTPEAVPA